MTIAASLLTRGLEIVQRPRRRRHRHLWKSKTTETHISTITFVLQHHLQHLIMGFGMSIKSSLSYWTLAKQLPYGRNFRKWSIIFRSALFCHLLFFVWWFWYEFSRLWVWHFKEQSKRKGTLTQKLGVLAPYRC